MKSRYGLAAGTPSPEAVAAPALSARACATDGSSPTCISLAFCAGGSNIRSMPFLFLVFQPTNTAYGVGFDPLGLKWNFQQHGRFSPYFELDGGVLFTNHDVPRYANDVNFTPSAAFGTHVLGAKYNWSVEIRYLHISNAGLAMPNPGINTVQVRLGVGRFFARRQP